jgi:hypothetical protein
MEENTRIIKSGMGRGLSTYRNRDETKIDIHIDTSIED